MKRIVSILAVLALLLCSTAALAAAPTCRNECTMEQKNLFSMLPIMDRNFVG